MAPSPLSYALAWTVVAAFVAGVGLERYRERPGRALTAFAWVVFAAFWLTLIPHFAFDQQSIIEGVLSAAAVPACVYTGYLLWRGRESLFVLSRAVAVMGVVYLPATTLTWIATPLVELVTRQIEWTMALVGYHPQVVQNEQGVRSIFVFGGANGPLRTEILLACTGLGSMTIFAGLIAAVRAPARRKLRALAIALPVIWVLNIVRNVFIALSFGEQWLQVSPELVMALFAETERPIVSFLVADRIISQSLSVVALVAILFLVLRELPELKTVVADVLYLVTGSEYDLGGEPPRGGDGRGVRADGRGPSGER